MSTAAAEASRTAPKMLTITANATIPDSFREFIFPPKFQKMELGRILASDSKLPGGKRIAG
jgi:hypothetical protein